MPTAGYAYAISLHLWLEQLHEIELSIVEAPEILQLPAPGVSAHAAD
ncbi:MAG: hypothetical protein RMZ41_008935 [Nostoc sp. DedVER02]